MCKFKRLLMRGFLFVFVLAGLLALGGTTGQVNTAHANGWVDGVGLVKWVPGTNVMTKLDVLMDCKAEFGFPIAFDNFEVWYVLFPPGQVPERTACLNDSPHVEYAEPDWLAEVNFTPNDPDYSTEQYGPQITQADLAWDITTGDSSVVVAVVDSGADFSHPDLQGKLIAGYDYVNDDEDPSDDFGHGTHVTGTIAATPDNSEGVAGIGYDTRVLVVKVLDENGGGSYSRIVQGIIYAADQGADIINLSLGGGAISLTLEDAVEYAWGKGALVVAAAGNESSDAPHYPASFEHALAVSATDHRDLLWSGSNYGSYISVAAPGRAIWSTDWLGGAGPYASRSGTSMAAPHVSAAAALLLAVDSNLSNTELWNIIESTADDLGDPGWDLSFGHGRLNVYQAVTNIYGNLTYQSRVTALETGYYEGNTWTPATAFDPGTRVHIRAHVKDVDSGGDISDATVNLTVSDPESGQTGMSGYTDANGVAEVEYTYTNTPGNYNHHVNDVVASGLTFDADASVVDGNFDINDPPPPVQVLRVDSFETGTYVRNKKNTIWTPATAFDPDTKVYLRVHVIDADTGSGVGGAAVNLTLTDPTAGQATLSGSTDSGGIAEIEYVNTSIEGSYDFYVDNVVLAGWTFDALGSTLDGAFNVGGGEPPPGDGTTRVTSIETGIYTGKGKTKTWTPTTEFDPGAEVTIQIHVVNADDGGDVADATVNLTVTDPHGVFTQIAGVTDGGGIAEIKYSATDTAGSYNVYINNVNYASWPFDPTGSTVNAAFTVSGGEPPPADGTTRVTSIETGYYVQNKNKTIWTPGTEFEAVAEVTIQVHVVNADDGGDLVNATVHLTVADPDGSPLAIASLTGSDGIAEIRYNATETAGDYTVHVDNAIYNGWPFDTAGSTLDSGFTVSGGGEPPPGEGPVISDVSAVDISTTTAEITWSTDVPATSQVEYGLRTTYGSMSSLSSGLVTSHSVTLTGLAKGKLYHFRVYSTDSEGNQTISEDYTFRTPR
jgi:thermitase